MFELWYPYLDMSELLSFVLSQGDQFRRSDPGSPPAVVGVGFVNYLLTIESDSACHRCTLISLYNVIPTQTDMQQTHQRGLTLWGKLLRLDWCHRMEKIETRFHYRLGILSYSLWRLKNGGGLWLSELS